MPCSCDVSTLCKVESNAGKMRYDTMNSKKYMVIPVSMIVEGVLNRAFVSAAEFTPEGWNGRPVTVNHPQVDGKDVSANSPKVLEQYAIGQIFNATLEGDKLKAEAWIDIAQAEKMGHSKLLKELKAAKKIEVSTGYFAKIEASEGEIKGNKYGVAHKDIKPDHLAILPNDTGACSVADGCGTFNKVATMKLKEALKVITNALGAKEDTVDKEKIINDLISNKKFAEEDRAALQAMSDAGLASLTVAEKAKAPTPERDAEPAPKAAVTAALTKEERTAIDLAVRNMSEQRKALTTKIVANLNMTEKQLEAMDYATLESIANGIKVEGNYGGRSFATETGKINPVALEAMKQPSVISLIQERNKKEAR